jgi:hypothetical protein
MTQVATASELERAASIAPALADAEKLAALVYDVLCRQAEGRSLFAGEQFIAGRAEHHTVAREAAETPVGNVLAMLERGPDSAMQWALLSALFVRGFKAAVQARPDERKALCAKLAAHCDFFELDSPYRVLALTEALLEPELAADVHEALAELVVRDASAAGGGEISGRARNAGRIAALGAAQGAAARKGLLRIEGSAIDAYSRALAAVALGRVPALPEPICRVRGRAGAFPQAGVAAVFSWLSGFALLRWAVRLVLRAVDYACEVEVELCGDALRLRTTVRLLGRTVRTTEQVHPIARLHFARRACRYPSLYLVLGAFSFAIGLLFGGVFAFDALRLGDGPLLLIALILLACGIGLDLFFDVLQPGRQAYVALDLDLERRQRVRIVDVPLEDADAMLGALSRRIAGAQEATRAVA